MTKSYLRGHEIEYLNDEWVYCDTKQPTVQTHKERACGYCGKRNTPEGHDGCLGKLQGIMNACCGHGQMNEAYVQFLDGAAIHGEDAITILKILRKEKHNDNSQTL
jgi:hypothetical protein